MINRWNDANEQDYASQHGISHPQLSQNILSQAYATTLLGADNDLTMHGGGNTSIKVTITITNDNGNDNGRAVRALYVKATGTPLSAFLPEHFVAMDLEYLESIKTRGAPPSDEAMASAFRDHQLLQSGGKLPSIESLMHAFIPAKVVDHTHPAAILKIVNRAYGAELLKECFGDDLAVVPYARMGYDLAMAVSKAAQENSGCKGVVMSHHGLIVWGDDAREVYGKTISIVNKAEEFLSSMASLPIAPAAYAVSEGVSRENYELFFPVVKECLSQALSEMLWDDGKDGATKAPLEERSISADSLHLVLLNTPDVLELIASIEGKSIICEPPMTPDYPMYSRILPLWVSASLDTEKQRMSSYIQSAIDKYASDYKDNLTQHGVSGAPPITLLPKAIVHPQVGVICVGPTAAAASMIADFTRQAFSIRRAIAESGGVYESLADEYIFDMQYRGYQRA